METERDGQTPVSFTLGLALNHFNINMLYSDVSVLFSGGKGILG
ncbi:hypothetical protein KMU_36960 [Proteus vulgaris]|nr:hypothetical protein KMU_36960 [Proteus vulgaris]